MNFIMNFDINNKLSEEDEKAKRKHHDDWNKIYALSREAYKEFMIKCNNDNKLIALLDKYAPIARVLRYEREKDTNFYERIVRGSGEFRDDYYFYNNDIYNKFRDIYNNWPTDKNNIEYTIDVIKKTPFMFNKNKKIKHWQKELEYITFAYNSIKESLEKESIQKDIKENKMDQVNSLIKNIKDIEKNHANEIATKYLKENPIMYTQSFKCCDMVEIENKKYNYPSEILDNAFNEVKQQTNDVEQGM